MPKTFLTLGCLLVLVTLPDYLPAFKDYKVFDWHTVPTVLDFVARKSSATPVEDELDRLRPDAKPGKFGVYPIIAPPGSLDSFFEALRQTELGASGAQVRVLHYGDSPTTADLITADVRHLLQQQFGDGGHGFHLMAKPWAWYEHRNITVGAEGWSITPANMGKGGGPMPGRFGLGAVSFDGVPGAYARFSLRKSPQERVELSALRQPGGGSMTVFADQVPLGKLNTGSGATEEVFATFDLPPGTLQLEIQVEGVNGAYINVVSRMLNEGHWTRLLEHAQPHLVVLNYGTNESVYEKFLDVSYENELREALRRVRKALPQASILIMSPMDRGQRLPNGTIGTVPALSRVVAIQQRVAAEQKCAFFNTFMAMGGNGTMGEWYAAEPRLVGADFIHPMPGGAKIVGNLFYRAVMDSYNKYKTMRLTRGFARVGGVQRTGNQPPNLRP
jgi:lysophospholipase L1-like esterase